MTQTFWLIAGVLILLALAFIIAPLIFHGPGRRAVLDQRHQNLLAYRSRLEELDRDHIVRVCHECGWRIKGADGAAERLGLKPSTLYFRFKKLGIERPDSKTATS